MRHEIPLSVLWHRLPSSGQPPFCCVSALHGIQKSSYSVQSYSWIAILFLQRRLSITCLHESLLWLCHLLIRICWCIFLNFCISWDNSGIPDADYPHTHPPKVAYCNFTQIQALWALCQAETGFLLCGQIPLLLSGTEMKECWSKSKTGACLQLIQKMEMWFICWRPGPDWAKRGREQGGREAYWKVKYFACTLSFSQAKENIISPFK